MAVQQLAGDVVVTVAKDRCSYGDGVAENPLCSVTTAVDLRLYFFDNDAFASLYRFHITQISRCNFIFRSNFRFPWYSRSPHFSASVEKLKALLEDASRAASVCRVNAGWR